MLFADHILGCYTESPCAPTSWRLNHGSDLRTARVRINALGVIVFDTWVSGTASFGAADLGRGFFDTGSLRGARSTPSSSDSRLLYGRFEGVARLGTVLLDEWSRGRRVLRAALLQPHAFDRRFFSGLVFRAKRATAGIRRRLHDRPSAITRTLSQAKTILRGLVLSHGAVANAGVR